MLQNHINRPDTQGIQQTELCMQMAQKPLVAEVAWRPAPPPYVLATDPLAHLQDAWSCVGLHPKEAAER
jgi:hypothetical protein